MNRERDSRALRRKVALRAAVVVLVVLLSVGLFLLGGFDSSAERAERLYQAALVAPAQDDDATLAAMQNVLRLDGQHRNARMAVGDILLRKGAVDAAFGQYQVASDQNKADLAPVVQLGALSILRYDWQAAIQYGQTALRLNAADPRSRALKAALDLRAGEMASDRAAIKAAAQDARAVLAQSPNDLTALWVVAQAELNAPAGGQALAPLDQAIALAPWSFALEEMKLSYFAKSADTAGGGAQLRRMYEKFPDNPDVQKWLLEYYTDAGATSDALALLRALAEPAGTDRAADLRVVDYARDHIGPDAAKAELTRLADVSAGTDLAVDYAAMVAGIAHDQGNLDEAIDMLARLLANAAPTDRTRAIQVTQAQWLAEAGRLAPAQDVISAVLAQDPGQTDAIKMRAGWLIAAGKSDEALAMLRTALTQNAFDPQVMLLMADAYRAQGAVKLEGERLKAALTASENGVVETLRLHEFLVRTGRIEVASAMLGQAILLHPGEIDLLSAAVNDAISRLDWRKADDLIAQMQAIGSQSAQAAAQRAFQVRVRLGAVAEAVDVQLRQAIRDAPNDVALALRLMREQVEQGRLDDALLTLRGQQRANPDDQGLLLLEAKVFQLMNKPDRAENILRDRLDVHPDDLPFVVGLYGLMQDTGRAAEAAVLLDRAMNRPDPPLQIRLLRAQELLDAGQTEGALSLLDETATAYPQSPEALVALARLAGTMDLDQTRLGLVNGKVAPLAQSDDPGHWAVYGWLCYRRGDFVQALDLLRRAAADLRDDPLVSLHLGQALLATGAQLEGQIQLRRVVGMATGRDAGVAQQAQRALDAILWAGPQ